MATLAEHMVLDFSRLLTEHGATHQVDGAELLCLIHPVELLPGEFERLMVERCKLSYLAGATAARFVDQQVVLDGATWTIVSINSTAVSVTWVLDRRVA